MNDERLTPKEEKLGEEVRKCYIRNFSNFIAESISLIYKYFGNDYNISFDTLFNESQDNYNFDVEELLLIDTLIKEVLENEYKLEIISKSKYEKLELKTID